MAGDAGPWLLSDPPCTYGMPGLAPVPRHPRARPRLLAGEEEKRKKIENKKARELLFGTEKVGAARGGRRQASRFCFVFFFPPSRKINQGERPGGGEPC